MVTPSYVFEHISPKKNTKDLLIKMSEVKTKLNLVLEDYLIVIFIFCRL
jgi:hypothetical protein